MEDSKTLKKIDDSAARLIKNVLDGQNGYGIDIEIIFKTKQGWVLMEFLKCESNYVTPCTSHPHKYWNKNWRKFVRLWEIAHLLNAKLYLINYEEKNENEYGKFRVMEVNMNIKPSEKEKIETKDILECVEMEDFRKFYMKINNNYEKID